MSSDKTFRFDESVCGRCGRTAPAGCICVGAKAFEPGRRVYAGTYAAGLGRMNNPQSMPKEEAGESRYRDYIAQSGDDERTLVRRVTGTDPFSVLDLSNESVSYVDDVEPETAEEEAAGKVPFDTNQPDVIDAYKEGLRDFEAARSKKTFRNDELVGYRTRIPHTREDDKWQSAQPFYGSSYVRNHSQDFFSEGFDIPVAEGDEEYSAGDEPFEDEGTKAFKPGERIGHRNRMEFDDFNELQKWDHDQPGTVADVDPLVIHRDLTHMGEYLGTTTSTPSNPESDFFSEGFIQEEKHFKALSDLIGCDVKAVLNRFYRDNQGQPRLSNYSDSDGYLSPERLEVLKEQNIANGLPALHGIQNPNSPYADSVTTEERASGPEGPAYNPSYYRRVDTPERLAEIAAEDDAEPEEYIYDGKMLSYLNMGSGGALVPLPEFTLKAKKKKKTVQGEGKSQQNLESGDPVLYVPNNEFADADEQKGRQQSGFIYEGRMADINPTTAYPDEEYIYSNSLGMGLPVRRESLFYDTSRKSQQNLEYGDPVLRVNRNQDADTQKDQALISIYGSPDPDNSEEHNLISPGSNFSYPSRGDTVFYDTSRANRRKSITPPRVKMGVMRATAPNRIDLVVEIVAKLFNEQAVQQFLQEMAGGIPPQQGKMFRRKAYEDLTPQQREALQRLNQQTEQMKEVYDGENRRYPMMGEGEQPLLTNPHVPPPIFITVDDFDRRNNVNSYPAGHPESDKSFGTKIILKRLRVPFVKNLRGHLVKAGFTGTMQDAMGRRMCFSAGKRVHCARDERGTHDDKVRQEEAPVPGNLSSGEGTANPVVQGIDVLKEIKFRIQGIASQCSLPPNAVRDVVLFLLEIPDEILIAFNAELDIRGEEIRAVLSQVIGSMVPQPEGMVDGGKPVPPSLKMLKKSTDDSKKANPPAWIDLIGLRSQAVRGSQEWHKYDEALRNSYENNAHRDRTNEFRSNEFPNSEPYDPVVRDDPPQEGQKGFPSPDLVLYEMQKNPNPTELERMQMELLMRILNDR